MNEKTCKNCKHQRAKLLTVEIDEEGDEVPVFERRCELTGRELRILDFSCGLWKERE